MKERGGKLAASGRSGLGGQRRDVKAPDVESQCPCSLNRLLFLHATRGSLPPERLRQVVQHRAVDDRAAGARRLAAIDKIGQARFERQQLRQFVAHLPEPCGRNVSDLQARPLWMVHQVDELANLFDGEAEVAAAADERQTPHGLIAVVAPAAIGSRCVRQEADFFVVPDGRHGAACLSSDDADGEGGSCHSHAVHCRSRMPASVLARHRSGETARRPRPPRLDPEPAPRSSARQIGRPPARRSRGTRNSCAPSPRLLGPRQLPRGGTRDAAGRPRSCESRLASVSALMRLRRPAIVAPSSVHAIGAFSASCILGSSAASTFAVRGVHGRAGASGALRCDATAPDPKYPGKQRDTRRCPCERDEFVGAGGQRRPGGGESGDTGGDRHGTTRDAGGPEAQSDFPRLHFGISTAGPHCPHEYGRTSSCLRSKRILTPESLRTIGRPWNCSRPSPCSQPPPSHKSSAATWPTSG